MFELSYLQRCLIIAALPLALVKHADTPLFDEIAGALVRLDTLPQSERIAHAFEAQRMEIDDAVAASIAMTVGISESELISARMRLDGARQTLAA